MPADWQNMKVGQLAATTRNALVGGPFGSNLVSADYVAKGVPVIRGQNMSGRWVDGEFVFVSEEKSKLLESNIARPGDIVFTQRGTLGQVSIVPQGPYDRYVVSQSQMKLTVNEDLADALFCYYVFLSPEKQNYIKQNATQSGVPHINLATLRDAPFVLPSINQQRAIAEILGSLDDKIEQNRRTNKVLESMARAIFKTWLVDFEPVKAKAAGATSFPGMPQEVFDRLPDKFVETELGAVPEGWVYVPIGDLVDVVGGATPSTKNLDFWEAGDNPFCTPKDMSKLAAPVLLDTERHITKAGVDKISSGQLPVGTILLSSRAPIGYLAIAATPVSVNQGIIAMLPGEIPSVYVLLWTEFNMEVIKSRAGGSTFAEISKRNFRPIPALKPDQGLLSLFGEVVQPLFDKIISNERESGVLARIRDTLLPKLISGELRVPDHLEAANGG